MIEVDKGSATESVLTIEIRIKHNSGVRDAIERHVDTLLDEGKVQALILDSSLIDSDSEAASASCTIAPYVKSDDEIEPCDECDGMRFPEEQHEDHCSLNPKNTI